MLRILRIPSRAAVASLIEEFDPRETTWVVSDLRSKFEVQKILLAKNGAYQDADVLRASDLWKTLWRRTQPGFRLISRDFARSVVRSFLKVHQKQLQLDVISERTVLAAMDRFAGIIFHPEGEKTVADWFAENPEALVRWGRHYYLARASLNHLRSLGLLTAQWIAAVLQSEEDFSRTWKKSIIVDLGAELTGAEAQLFLALSRKVDVTLIEPAPVWRSESELLLRPYRDIEGYASEIRSLECPKKSSARRSVLRMSGQLAEVKEAVCRARAWMDAGVSAEKIAILAAEIEDYWPVLRTYMKEEGLPADKPVSTKLNSLPSVTRWLSRLRPHRGELTAADLELSFYASENSSKLRSEEFQSLFTHLYGEEDLSRHPLVEKFFREGPKFREVMDRDSFLPAAALFWDGSEELTPFSAMAREVLANATAQMELPLTEWIRYLEAIAANREITLQGGEAGGILVTNFISAQSTQTTHRIFLGLSEESLKKVERNPIPLHEVRQLSDLGFHLDHPDHSLLEFELRWLSGDETSEDVFTVGNSAFDGSVRAPSALWLRFFSEVQAGEESEKLSLPGATRWDLLQKASLPVWAENRDWSAKRSQDMQDRIQIDLGEKELPPVTSRPVSHLSPSVVKKYLDCPFIVAGSSLFRLKDLEEIDLDFARSDWGTLTHAVFQALTDEGWIEKEEVSEKDLTELVQKIREEKNFILGEEKLWGPFLKRQVRVATEFLRVEKEWKRRFPTLHLLPSESTWALWFNAEDGSFDREEKPGFLKLTGRIDRLETDQQGRFVVVDYKATASAISDQNHWFSENELQLLFYLWALERGALPGVEGRGIGAFYYVYRDFSRNRGLQVESEAGTLFPSSGTKKNLGVDEERKKELFALLEDQIRDVLQKMQKGQWQPHPRKEDLCRRCHWKVLCRAPHLN